MPKTNDVDFTEKIAPKGEQNQQKPKRLEEPSDMTEHIAVKQSRGAQQRRRTPPRTAQQPRDEAAQNRPQQKAEPAQQRQQKKPQKQQEGGRSSAAKPEQNAQATQNAQAAAPRRIEAQAAQNARAAAPRRIEAQATQNARAAAPRRIEAQATQNAQAAAPRGTEAQATQNAQAAAPRGTEAQAGRRAQAPRRKTPVRIISLGGLHEIGKNMTVIECGNDMLVVDVGLSFPDEEMPGVDIVIPDFTYVEKNQDKLRGVVLTHGHEDHIGGLAYLLKTVNTPVYSSRLTVGLMERKLKEHGLLGKAKLNVVKPRDTVKMGCMTVEFIHVNHSIPDALALAIHTPAGVIVMTGDFKIDPTPIEGGMIDLARFGELGSKGVLALLMDSTNATKPGMTPSERTVGAGFANLFQRAQDKRIIIASFASNIHRIQQIVDYAAKYKRKVAVSGRSMVNVVAVATELGYLKVPEGILVEIDGIGRYRPDQLVIITTGSQGEPMSALSRMSMGDHRKVTVTPNDFIIISASPIPGNEKTVGRVVNELLKLGAEVIYEKMYEVHVSGHACQEELKLILGLTKPQFFIPVHGEYMHLRKNAENAMSMGMSPKNILLTEIGKVIELDGVDIKVIGSVPAGRVMVDGLGVGDVGSVVLRDRKHLAEDGLIIVATAIDSQTGEIVAGPDIVSRGFVYVREAEDMMTQTRLIAKKVIESCLASNTHEWSSMKTRIKDDVGDYLWQVTKRTPMVLPVIQEV